MSKSPPASTPSWAERTKDGWRFSLRVQPGARRSQILGPHGEELKVSVAAPATDNKANSALVRFLAKMLGVAANKVTITKGFKGRSKRVLVNSEAALERLIPHLPEDRGDNQRREDRA